MEFMNDMNINCGLKLGREVQAFRFKGVFFERQQYEAVVGMIEYYRSNTTTQSIVEGQ